MQLVTLVHWCGLLAAGAAIAGLATGVPALFVELARRGWTGDRLAKLARGNVLRVWRAAARR